MMEKSPLEQQYTAAAAAGAPAADVDRLGAAVDAAAATLETKLRSPEMKLQAALWYAGTIGVPVFPCKPGDKQPATLHGLLDATRSPDHIRGWWTLWPQANPAYPTGQLFDVIDVDGPEGVNSWGILRQTGQLPPIIAAAVTPRGFHYYIKPTGDGNTTNLMPGIDFRGNGGYVLAPPSWYAGAPAGPKSPAKPAGFYRWTDPLTAAKLR